MTRQAINRKIVLASRPQGWVVEDNFALIEEPAREVGDGEVAVRVDTFSLDPYQRGRMNEARSYAPSLALGDVIVAAAVGTVVESRSDRFAVGDAVLGYFGWQEQVIWPAKHLQRIDTSLAPARTYLGAAGLPGVTAWMGLHLIGHPDVGETVVVSAAAGAVGGVAGQLAKAAGARVVGIAGGAAKCRYVTDELGFDAAVDYQAPDFETRLAAATPDGVDVYFENVGGQVSRAVFERLNDFARVPLCGLVSEYNSAPDTFWDLSQLLARRIRVEGFICSDHMDLWPKAVAALVELHHAGRLRSRETIAEGLASAPSAFIGMLKGSNVGKQLVALA